MCIEVTGELELETVSFFHAVDKQLCFQDAYVFYQFSSDECGDTVCEFGGHKGWQMGVRLLKQLASLAPLTSDICDVSADKFEDTTDTNSKILQIQALARLTSAVMFKFFFLSMYKFSLSGSEKRILFANQK
ncbi:hypothetical protein FKM82_017706 [Ascaphus truei]